MDSKGDSIEKRGSLCGALQSKTEFNLLKTLVHMIFVWAISSQSIIVIWEKSTLFLE
jgi:hypothetical protein